MEKEVRTKPMKEVRISSQEELRLALLKAIKNNIRPTQFAKANNIKKQKLSYHLSILKGKELIKKVGYGTWEIIKRSPKLSQDPREIRGHAFIWKIKIPRRVVTNWKTRCVKFMIPFEVVGVHKVPRIIVDSRKIWLGKKNIVIYENTSFMGNNAIESRKYAIYEMLELVKKIEDKLLINLGRPIIFTPGREHFAMIQNSLAIQCNKKKEPIRVRDMEGYWLSTDNSLNQDELETDGKNAFGTNLQLQKWFNDHKEHKFKVTPTFVMNAINKNTQNLESYAVHLKSHVKSVQELGEGVKQQTKIFEKILKVLEKKV